jgi:hypothetical protein
MKYILLTLALTNMAFATGLKSDHLLASKLKFESKAFALKLTHEKELKQIQNKSSGEEAFAFEKDVDMECVNWVYQGPSSREEAVAVCRGVHSIECAQWVYQGPSSRVESVEACRGVSDMECVRYVYQGPASRVEAAQACAGGGHRPRPRPNDDCRP